MFTESSRIIRSGNRNNQMASMASITLMSNPLRIINSSTGVGFLDEDLINYNNPTMSSEVNPRIINASAIEYSEDWPSQCENNLPNQNGFINGIGIKVNEFLYNIKGNWRPIKSYAYLTGRNNLANNNTRNSGFFTKYNSFYKRGTSSGVFTQWQKDLSNWTFASEVSKYNPYGVELENKDALNRYSSAQYGYKYKLPVAVASNSKYSEMGFDGFEDYNFENFSTPSPLKPHFSFSQSVSTDARVTNKKSHSGTSSIVVKPNKEISLRKKIHGCKI